MKNFWTKMSHAWFGDDTTQASHPMVQSTMNSLGFGGGNHNAASSSSIPARPPPPPGARPTASQLGPSDHNDGFDEDLDVIQDMLGDLKDRTGVISKTLAQQARDTERLADHSAIARDRMTKQRRDLDKAMGKE